VGILKAKVGCLDLSRQAELFGLHDRSRPVGSPSFPSVTTRVLCHKRLFVYIRALPLYLKFLQKGVAISRNSKKISEDSALCIVVEGVVSSCLSEGYHHQQEWNGCMRMLSKSTEHENKDCLSRNLQPQQYRRAPTIMWIHPIDSFRNMRMLNDKRHRMVPPRQPHFF